MFSGKHSFSKTQLVKPIFQPCQKNTLFQKKVSFLFFFCNFRWNPYFYCVSCFALFWSKKFWPKQIVCTKMRVFPPVLTQIVSGNFCYKSIFLIFHIFGWPPLKNPIFVGLFGLSIFFFFCFHFSNIKKETKNKKCNFLFENLIFDNPKFCKSTILTHCDTICVSKNAQKHYKTGENSKTKLGPIFNL